MKPELVTMQAFGPYLDKTECDFRQLYSSQLFLITGPTGGGKTSILDAICFALYGKATGSTRDDLFTMRNLSAPDEVDTVVECIFTLGASRYKFERRLHIHTKKRSGERDIQTTAECSKFINNEWKQLDPRPTQTSVTKRAEEILGFNHSQFSQVIVLPQGEFKKLLTASSEEKVKILQVLFDTNIWENTSASLSKEKINLSKELESLNISLSSQIESTGVKNLDELNSLTKDVQKQYEQTLKSIQLLLKQKVQAQAEYNDAQQLLEKFKSLNCSKEQLTIKQNNSAEIDKIRVILLTQDRLRNVLPFKKHFDELTATSKQKQTDFVLSKFKCETSQKNFEQAQADARELDHLKLTLKQLTAESTLLKSSLEEASTLHNKHNLVQQLEKKVSVSKEIQERAKQEQFKNEQSIAKGEDFLEKLRRLIEIETSLSTWSQLTKNRKKLDEQLSELEKAKEISVKSRLNLKELETRQFKNTAAALASALVDETPCPVCGSVHHPAPEIGDVDTVSTKEIEKAKIKQSADDEKLTQITTTIEITKSALNQLEDECKRLENNGNLLKEHSSLTEILEKPESPAKQLVDFEKRLKEAKQRRKYLSENLATAEADLSKFNIDFSAASTDLQLLLTRIGDRDYDDLKEKNRITTENVVKLGKNIEKIEKDFKYAELALTAANEQLKSANASLAEANENVQTALSNLIVVLSDNSFAADEELPKSYDSTTINAYKKSVSDYDSTVEGLKINIKTSEKELAEKQCPDIDLFKKNFYDLSALFDLKSESKGKLLGQLESLKTALKNVKSTTEKFEKVEKLYSKTARVADYVAGINPQKTKLHTFVLGLMLDKVIESAGRYLNSLSRGRYTLTRSTEQTGGNSKKGLDIDVIDSQILESRSVNTLSGGELFLASLSLAFGLAEVVQSRSGGIELDSIFIDEGFGTLDNETLEAAMKALAEIQREGRLVGIVSHVAELKDRIPARIEIVPTDSGSTLKIITL